MVGRGARQLRLVLAMDGVLAAAVVVRVLALVGVLAFLRSTGWRVAAGLIFAAWEIPGRPLALGGSPDAIRRATTTGCRWKSQAWSTERWCRVVDLTAVGPESSGRVPAVGDEVPLRHGAPQLGGMGDMLDVRPSSRSARAARPTGSDGGWAGPSPRWPRPTARHSSSTATW